MTNLFLRTFARIYENENGDWVFYIQINISNAINKKKEETRIN